MTEHEMTRYCTECGHLGKEMATLVSDRAMVLQFECNLPRIVGSLKFTLPATSQDIACRNFAERIPCALLKMEQTSLGMTWKCKDSILNARGVSRCCTKRCEEYDAVRPVTELEKFAVME